jgi:ribosomal protein S21
MAVNVQVVARRRETTEELIKRFSRKVRKEKIMEEFRERMYYEKPSDKKRRLRKRSKAETK